MQMHVCYSKPDNRTRTIIFLDKDGYFHIEIVRRSETISVDEVLDLLYLCKPYIPQELPARTIDASYTSYYKHEKTPNSSTPYEIVDPVFNPEGYSFKPIPYHPDYPQKDIFIGWGEWYDPYGKYFYDYMFNLEVEPREDGKLYVDDIDVNFKIKMEELPCLIKILEVINNELAPKAK